MKTGAGIRGSAGKGSQGLCLAVPVLRGPYKITLLESGGRKAAQICAVSYLMSDWSRELGWTCCWTISVPAECQTVSITSPETSFREGLRV